MSRVEPFVTDGNGNLVRVAARGMCYGVPRDRLYTQERPTIVKQNHSRRRAARNSKIDTLAAMIATCPGKTARELCELTGYGGPAMCEYLKDLRAAGTVSTIKTRRRGHGPRNRYYVEGAV